MMNPQDYLKSDVLDIIFEGRNKTYGAYFLRKVYEKHVRNSLVIGALAVFLGISAPLIYSKIKSQLDAAKPKIVSMEMKDYELPADLPPPPPPPPKKKEPPPPPRNTVKYTPPEPKPDEDVTQAPPPPPPTDNTADIGSKTRQGDNSDNQTQGTVGNAPEPTPDPVEKPADDEVFTIVEQQAEFPDGQAALFSG